MEILHDTSMNQNNEITQALSIFMVTYLGKVCQKFLKLQESTYIFNVHPLLQKKIENDKISSFL
jgi:hypothetical protein